MHSRPPPTTQATRASKLNLALSDATHRQSVTETLGLVVGGFPCL